MKERGRLREGIYLPDDKMTVESFLHRYLEGYSKRSLRVTTFEGYSSVIQRHINPEIGKLRLSQLRADHLNLLYSKKLDAGLSNRSVDYIHGILRRALNKAVKWGLLPKNPTDMASPPAVKFKIPSTWTSNEQIWEFPRFANVCTPRLSFPHSTDKLMQQEEKHTKLLNSASALLANNKIAASVNRTQEARQITGYERSPQALQLWRQLALFSRRSQIRTAWQSADYNIHKDSVLCVTISKDGRFALSGSCHHSIYLWDVLKKRSLGPFASLAGFVSALQISKRGNLALSGSWDSTVRLWEVPSGKCISVFRGHKDQITTVSLSREGRFALSGSKDETLRLWEISSGRCIRVFKGHKGNVNSACLSSDGRFALSGGADATLCLWKLSSGKCIRIFNGNMGVVHSVSLNASMTRVLTGEEDHLLRLWDFNTGDCLRTFEGHTDAVLSARFSADGEYAISSGRDKTLRLWKIASGECLITLEGHTDSVLSVDISGDSNFAISGGFDQTVKIWELDWELEAHEMVDWDEGALPYLKTFLTQRFPKPHIPFYRPKTPYWNDEDFQILLSNLQHAGYGWLNPIGVEKKLMEYMNSVIK